MSLDALPNALPCPEAGAAVVRRAIVTALGAIPDDPGERRQAYRGFGVFAEEVFWKPNSDVIEDVRVGGKRKRNDNSLVGEVHRHARDIHQREVPLLEFALWETLRHAIAQIDTEDIGDDEKVLAVFGSAFMNALQGFSGIEKPSRAWDGPIPAVVKDFHNAVVRGFQSFDDDQSFAVFLARIPAIVQGERAQADSEEEFAAGVLQWLMISLMCGSGFEPPSEVQITVAKLGVRWFFDLVNGGDTASGDTASDDDATATTEHDMSLGQQFVREIYESMSIDRQWSVVTETGFAWWPHRLSQAVFTMPFASPDLPGPFEEIRQRIDLVQIRGDASSVVAQVDALNNTAVLGAYLVDPDEGVVAFSSRVKMHRDNIWMDSLLKMTCAAAAVTTEADVESIASELSGTPMWSQHPVNGPRPDADDLVDSRSDFFEIARSAKAVQIGDHWLASALEQVRPYGITGSFHHGVIRAYCSTGGDSADGAALIEINTNGSHPLVGPVVEWSCTLTREVDGVGGSGASLACRLNWFEATASPVTHQLGAWFAADSRVTHRVFIPWICLTGTRSFDVLVVNILLEAVLHARLGTQALDADIFEGDIPHYPPRPFHD